MTNDNADSRTQESRTGEVLQAAQAVATEAVVKNNQDFTEERETLHRQMLSAVSHDLKTPLASIIGSLEIYERMGGQLTPAKRETLIKTALVEAYRLDSFLTNILDMAKLENNLVPLRREPTDLRQLLETMVGTLGASRKGKATIAINGPEKFDVNVDGTLLSRAIALLLDNAVKHAGPSPKIDSNYEKPIDGVLTIEIVDDGPGVPMDKRDEIFSKYARLQRGDHQNAGTGLGLSIAQIIAVRLGGDVVLKLPTSGEQGARFVLTCKA